MKTQPQPETEHQLSVPIIRDNSTHDEFENVANPIRPGSEDASGEPGQNGRNLRALGSTDQDSANGLLRMHDQDSSTMEVTPEAEKSIVNPNEATLTATVAVTTAGPDDDASADETPVPAAEKAAKEAVRNGQTNDGIKRPDQQPDPAQALDQIGTDLNFEPAV